mgnify:CR=1 FL=1
MEPKEQKRKEAKERQAVYDKLTSVEKAERNRLWRLAHGKSTPALPHPAT